MSGIHPPTTRHPDHATHAPTLATAPAFDRALWRRRLLWIVLIAFLLRVTAILALHTYKFRTTEAGFGFGWEMGRIAKSIATGHGYSSPFVHETSFPTAWEPPLYPYLMAGVYKLLGVYSRASAFVLLTINSFFSALTCVVLFFLGRRMFNVRVGKWAAWTWALFPYAMYWAVKWPWETSISAFLLTTLLLLTLKLKEARTLLPWLGWGALWGVAALLNPSVLAVLPLAAAWLVWQRLSKTKQWLAGCAASAIVFLLVVSPWLVRNYRVFGEPVFIRSNFGAELRMGNGPGAAGVWMSWLHPTHNPLEFEKYSTMGESRYVHMRQHEALRFIRENPGTFAGLCLRRFVYYWADPPWGERFMPPKNALFLASSVLAFWGLAVLIRRRVRGGFLLAAVLVAYPLVYYLVSPHPRYRAPIEPVIALLIVYVVSQTSDFRHKFTGESRSDCS